MLNWITSLYGDWSGRQQRETGTEEVSEVGDGTSGADGAERTVERVTDGGVSLAPDTPTSPHDLLDGEPVSKQAVYVEFGLEPHEFLAWLVRDAGGQMWQTDLVETTGWAKSTVSRYLETLEENGTVVRVLIGRSNLVGIPGEMPDAVSTPDVVSMPDVDSAPDGSSADPPSRWTTDADEPV